MIYHRSGHCNHTSQYQSCSDKTSHQQTQHTVEPNTAIKQRQKYNQKARVGCTERTMGQDYYSNIVKNKRYGRSDGSYYKNVFPCVLKSYSYILYNVHPLPCPCACALSCICRVCTAGGEALLPSRPPFLLASAPFSSASRMVLMKSCPHRFIKVRSLSNVVF
jgi:hypothetical protein